jgi:hypothetical protein
LHYELQLGEEKEACWCKDIWQVQKLGDDCHLMFCKKITNQKGGMFQSIVMMAQPFFSPPQIGPFSPHCLSQPFHHI